MIQNPTVLVITDNPPIRYWVKKHLENQFSLIDAHTALKAIETVETSHIDFVIIDGTFSEMDPILLSTKIRNMAPKMAFPILLITGRLKKTYREAALASGVTDFLSDQLDPEELQTKIATGKKTTQSRQKVSTLTNLIAAPKPSNNSLKDKLLNKATSMLIVQIDQFSTIHAKDEIQSAFLNLLKAEQPNTSSTSNGQFVIFLTDADPAQCKKVAETVQKKIQSHTFKTKDGPQKITASFAISKVDIASYDKTIAAATSALKQSSKKKNSIFSIDQEFHG